MHDFLHQKYPEYAHVVYPGTLFAGYHSDLENNAKGKKRGIVFVEFDDNIKNVEFVPVDNAEYEIIEVDSAKKRSTDVNIELLEKIRALEPENKIIIIKIEGELSEGKTTDIDFTKIKDELQQKSVLDIKINRNQLTSKEYTITQANGKDKYEIETNIFSENIGEIRLEEKELVGNAGVQTAKRLLREITQSILDNEKKSDYNKRIEQSAIEILGLKVEEW